MHQHQRCSHLNFIANLKRFFYAPLIASLIAIQRIVEKALSRGVPGIITLRLVNSAEIVDERKLVERELSRGEEIAGN